MTVERIETVERFAQLREEWNALLQTSASDCVFLTHEWLFTWWKHLAEERGLRILTARVDGQLIGIMPLALRGAQYSRMMPKALEFLGSGVIGSDYLDVVAMKGHEDEVMRVFGEHLTRMGLVLQLSQLKRDSCLAAKLAGDLQRNRWTAAETKMNVCPFINFEGHTWESYLATLSSSQRYNFNRRMKNLMKTPGARLECVEAPEDVRSALDILIALHQKRWTGRGTSEAFQTDAIVEFHREFAELAANRHWLRIFVLWIDKVPVAALYGLRYGETFYFYQSGFDPDYSKQSVGLVMMGLAIKAAAEGGATEYDLLHGGEEYKYHWARETRDLGRIELYPRHARAAVYKRAVDLNRAARKMARRVLGKALL